MTTSTAFTLDADTFQKISPAEYLRKFVTSGCRPDGRALNRGREVEVRTGAISSTTALGSSQVNLGLTSVVCGIKAQVAQPHVDRPLEGFLVPNVDLSPICSSKFRPGPPSELTQTISHHLAQVVASSRSLSSSSTVDGGTGGIVDLQQLCIVQGSACWVLYADILCLNYDGNVFDAALIALIAALQNVKLPKAVYSETEGIVRTNADITTPLIMQRIPISVSIGIYDSQYLLLDPTNDEETVLGGLVTIVHDDRGSLVAVLKLGGEAAVMPGTSLSRAQLNTCLDMARKRDGEIRRKLSNS